MAKKTKDTKKVTEELDEEVEKDEDYESLRQKLIEEYNTKKSGDSAEGLEESTEENEEDDEDLEDDFNESEELEDQEPEEEEFDDEFQEESSSDSLNLKNDEYDIDREVNAEPRLENSADLPSDNQNLDTDIKQLYQNTAPDVDQGQSKVAIGNKKNVIVFVIIGIIALFSLYKFFQSANPAPAEPVSQVDTNIPITKPVEDTGQSIVVPQLPKAPEVPKLAAPTPPAAPIPPIVSDLAAPPAVKTSSSSPDLFNKSSKADLDRKKSKIASSMIIGGGEGKSSSKNTSKSGQSLTILQRNNDQVVATNIGDLRRVIAQGKIIDATLETAINTDIPGSVRALVSRDIFSENGSNVLIPRGSRLIGTYSSTVSFGINRLSINWTRLIRPDGVDINIASPGIDAIGRSGMPGDLNNHIVGTLTAAILTSIIDVGVAAFADSQTSTDTTTTSYSPTTTSTTTTGTTTVTTPTINTGGTVTTGTTPTQTDTAYQSAVSKIGSTGQNIVQQFQNLKPTITIDQGAPLKVFVNKDLVFPGTSANLTKVIE